MNYLGQFISLKNFPWHSLIINSLQVTVNVDFILKQVIYSPEREENQKNKGKKIIPLCHLLHHLPPFLRCKKQETVMYIAAWGSWKDTILTLPLTKSEVPSPRMDWERQKGVFSSIVTLFYNAHEWVYAQKQTSGLFGSAFEMSFGTLKSLGQIHRSPARSLVWICRSSQRDL